MTPVQSQPIGQYPLAAPALGGSGRPTPTAATALDAAFSPIRSTSDGVHASFCEPQPRNPAQPSPTQGGTTQGSTGNSFLDLISQLMSQLDSFINGLGTNGGTAGAAPAPVADPGGSAMQQLLSTGEVT